MLKIILGARCFWLPRASARVAVARGRLARILARDVPGQRHDHPELGCCIGMTKFPSKMLFSKHLANKGRLGPFSCYVWIGRWGK